MATPALLFPLFTELLRKVLLGNKDKKRGPWVLDPGPERTLF